LILVAAFMVVLDFSIVNVALPSIERELHMPADAVQWVVTGYAISFGGLLILGGRAADLLGRRRMFVAGLIAFSLASLAGGLARDPVLLIAARVVQGAGAAIVAPAPLFLIITVFPEGRELAPSACTVRSPRLASWPARFSAASWCSSPAGARFSWSTSRSA
jgi:MFS family permease